MTSISETITDADYTVDLALLANTLAQAESLVHRLEQAAGDIGLDTNANKKSTCVLNEKELSPPLVD